LPAPVIIRTLSVCSIDFDEIRDFTRVKNSLNEQFPEPMGRLIGIFDKLDELQKRQGSCAVVSRLFAKLLELAT